MLNSDGRCWLCGSYRRGYRQFRAVALLAPWVLALLLVPTLIWLAYDVANSRMEREQERMAEQQQYEEQQRLRAFQVRQQQQEEIKRRLEPWQKWIEGQKN